jgi:sortase A
MTRGGVVLIVVGLILIGYTGWEFYGTNIVSRHYQHQAVDRLHEAWGQGDESVQTNRGIVNAIIKIPRLGSGYEQPILEGTGETQLATGFGHFTGTAGPGQVGNFALAAHRVTHGEPLHDMPELQTGDLIVIETQKLTYIYKLTNPGGALTVDFHQTWVTDPLPTNPVEGGIEPAQRKHERLITLTTCSEFFHTDNRLIAFGVLVKTEPTPPLDG